MQLGLEPKLLGVVYFLKELAADKGINGQEKKKMQFIRLYPRSKAKTKEAAEETKPKFKGSTMQRRQEETLKRQRKRQSRG